MLENCLETTLYTSGSMRINVQLNQIKIRANFPLNFYCSFALFCLAKDRDAFSKLYCCKSCLAYMSLLSYAFNF